MNSVRHPNRRRQAASAIVRALIAWHGGLTTADVLERRRTWPRWPRITPDRTPPGGAALCVVQQGRAAA